MAEFKFNVKTLKERIEERKATVLASKKDLDEKVEKEIIIASLILEATDRLDEKLSALSLEELKDLDFVFNLIKS